MSQETSRLVTVKIRLHGFLSRFTDREELTLQVEPGTTVASIIHLLTHQLGQDFRHTLMDWRGEVHGGIEILLNREQILPGKASKTIIWDDSELVIFPMVGGG